MTKGTTSQGPRHLKAHTFCRRCGRRAFHRQKKICGACGFPRTTMRRYDGVYGKVRGRKGQGTGRMKYLKDIPRKFKNHFEKIKIVRFFLKPDREKMAQRMCLSEHPFGTIKRAMGSSYFLLKGMRKVTGEFALFCLGYNLERAKNLLGFQKMMELMVGA